MSTHGTTFPGARFYRADLHLHTPASKCWQGARCDDTLLQIFRRIREREIQVVAITDHNSVASVDEAKSIGKQLGIHVYPGVEVSTWDGHVLAIFDPAKPTREIADWLTRIGFPESSWGDDSALAKGPNNESSPITEVLRRIDQEGGVAVAAHPYSKSGGFWEVMKKKGTARLEAYSSPYLRGIEAGDDPGKILPLASGRVPGYTKKYACICSSDAHTVDEVGRRFTYIKLGDLGIGALKQVLYDPAMRIRFAHDWPPKPHPWVQGLGVSQGFFRGVPFLFHPDMTCLVGGKAKGKSLLIELIRFALGLKSPISGINSESQSKMTSPTCLGEGGTVTLRVVSKEGEAYRIERTVSSLDKGPEVFYGDTQTKATDRVSDIFQCKIYSQNEITELGRDLPALLDWLDTFIDLSEDRKLAANLREEMRVLLDRLDAAYVVASRENDLQAKLRELQDKRALLDGKIRDPILKQFPLWQKEGRYLVKLQEALDKIRGSVEAALQSETLQSTLPKPEQGTPNAEAIAEQRSSVLALENDFITAKKALLAAMEAKVVALADYTAKWEEGFVDAQRKHEDVIKSAGVANASALASELNKVTQAIEEVADALAGAATAVREKAKIENRLRNRLMPSYNMCFATMYRKRLDKAAEITNGTGGFVRVQARQMSDRADFEGALTTLARGSRLKGQEIEQITRTVTPVELTTFIIDKNAEGLAKQAGIKPERASALMEHTWGAAHDGDGNQILSPLYSIALTELRDAVIVELCVDGHTYKPMQELSVGSKCTAILSVALNEGTCPLIVDQPEDSLDNPFVFEQIVKTVRRSKEGRQYIFATHNPNVAVASDADLVCCLEATATQGSIGKDGSVDAPSARDRVMVNLEGGRDAFVLRRQKYDIVVDDPNAVVLDIAHQKDAQRPQD